jgi:hypothetical protein
MASRSIRGILRLGQPAVSCQALWDRLHPRERSKGAFFMWRFHLKVDTANTKLGVKSCDHGCFNGWFVHCVIMN